MINVTKTYLPNVEKYKEYVDQIFQSGWLTNNGQLVKMLEQKLKEYLRVKNIVLVSNGTIALQVAYKLLELKGEVITTPFSFTATTSSLVWENLTPVFADIDEDTFCMDPELIEGKITNKTSAILPVHVFGNGCYVEKINSIAKKYNLKVIYDAAHAFGVNYDSESILNYGDVSVLSFHATKIFHTIEGGALIINDDNLYEKAKKMINFGITGPETVEELGINAKMNEFQAAMGLCVLENIEIILGNRKRIYEYYLENLPKDITLQKYNERCTYNYAYFPVVFRSEEDLLNVKYKLNKKNIHPRRYFYPSLETLPYLKSKQNNPISNSISKRILCLPMGFDLKEEDVINITSEIF